MAAEDEAEFGVEDFLEKFEVRDSDCDSLCTSEESEGASSEDADAASENDEEATFKKAYGTNVHFSNGYFTFTNNSEYPDVKVSVMSRWCKKEHLGTSEMSRTVVPAHFGEPREAPTRSWLVLKAWMLGKARTSDFCNQKATRRRLFAAEARELKAAIIGLSSEAAPSTGNDAADKLVNLWAPDVLASFA